MQGYNAQAVVKADQIILAAEVTTETNDVHHLTGMLKQAQANVEATLGAAVADAGYWSEANAKSQTEECELFIVTQNDHKQRAALRDPPVPRGRIRRFSLRYDPLYWGAVLPLDMDMVATKQWRRHSNCRSSLPCRQWFSRTRSLLGHLPASV